MREFATVMMEGNDKYDKSYLVGSDSILSAHEDLNEKSAFSPSCQNPRQIHFLLLSMFHSHTHGNLMVEKIYI